MAYTNSGDIPAYPARTRRQTIILTSTCGLGTASIAGTLGDNDCVTWTRTGVGTYNITWPPCSGPASTNTTVCAWVSLSATPTIANAVVVAIAQSAGTATIKTYPSNSAIATDGAAGDAISVEITLPASGAVP